MKRIGLLCTFVVAFAIAGQAKANCAWDGWRWVCSPSYYPTYNTYTYRTWHRHVEWHYYWRRHYGY